MIFTETYCTVKIQDPRMTLQEVLKNMDVAFIDVLCL